MSKLILSVDGLVLKDIKLERERLGIGRNAHNRIQIEHPAISGDHAVVTSVGDEVFVEDLDSTNGTSVNGRPVRKHLLCSDDVIGVGQFRFLFQRDTPAPLPPAGTALIRVLNGANAGKALPLTKALTSLGKPGVQVAMIARDSQGYSISHAEGDTPTLLNGQPLDVRGHALEDRDLIEISGVQMEFFLKP